MKPLLFHTFPDLRTNGERSSATRSQVHETAVVSEPPISEQPGQHCQRLVRECLVHEWLLPFQRFQRAARWESVLLIELRVYEFREEFGRRR
jgi:hypothetical protein